MVLFHGKSVQPNPTLLFDVFCAQYQTKRRHDNPPLHAAYYHIRNSSRVQYRKQHSNKRDSSVLAHWLEQLKTPPNLITLARISSTPLLSYLILSQQHSAALIGCCLAALSDVADGYLARNHGMTTVLGSYLDPLADKIVVNALALSLWGNGTLPTELVVLWITKDVALIVGSYVHVASRTQRGLSIMDPLTTPLRVNPTLISKFSTALQFATLAVGIVHPLAVETSLEWWLDPSLTILCWLTGCTTVASGASYVWYNAFSSSENRKTIK